MTAQHRRRTPSPTRPAVLRHAKGEQADWMDHAACKGVGEVDPDLFFPQQGESTKEAKAVCAGCPVRVQCLEYALTPPVEKHGIWGGLSEQERRTIRCRRNQARRTERERVA